jgi:Zn-dependent protease with chaperone function
MPYSQIIAIMAAVMLISGAPLTKSSLAPPLSLLSYWLIKTILWAIACRIVLVRARARALLALSANQLPVGLLEFLALIPLAIDMYFLGVRYPFVAILGHAWGGFLSEIFGLGLYLFYMSIVWVEAAKVVSEKDAWQEAVSETRYRFRLIVPILVPYIALTFISQAGNLTGIRALQAFQESDWGILFMLAVTIVFFLVFMPVLVVKMWNCAPFDDPIITTDIRALLDRLGTRFRAIVMWMPGRFSACTAAVLGVLTRFRYLLLTPCIVSILALKELEAVVAHEVAHVRHRHLLWYMAFVITFSMILYRLADNLVSWFMARPFALELLLLTEKWPQSFLALLAVAPLALIMVVYFRFVIGYFMRNFERQADMEVFKVHGHPWHLIVALKKVAAASGIEESRPNWHHFSIAQRIAFLRDAASMPELLRRQERKILLSKAVFLICAVILFYLPSFMPTESWRDQAQINLVETYFEQLMRHGQDRPQWFMFMGQFFYERKIYDRAEAAYKKVLEMDPDNADAMNNLAWLYLKAEDGRFRRPKDALLLAIQAASLKKSPYILDTLAEAYFANGYVEKAVAAEEEAVGIAIKNRQYYLDQLKRYRQALINRGNGPGQP